MPSLMARSEIRRQRMTFTARPTIRSGALMQLSRSLRIHFFKDHLSSASGLHPRIIFSLGSIFPKMSTRNAIRRLGITLAQPHRRPSRLRVTLLRPAIAQPLEEGWRVPRNRVSKPRGWLKRKLTSGRLAESAPTPSAEIRRMRLPARTASEAA